MPRPGRLPKKVPSGTRYVVEGRSMADGRFRVSARYLVYPDGQRVDMPGETVLPISCCGNKGATCAKDAKRTRRPARRSRELGLQLGA